MIPTLTEVIEAVALEMQLKNTEIIGQARHAYVVRARHLAMYLCRSIGEYSFHEIGNFFGRRDHTTVMNACANMDALLVDPRADQTRNLITKIRERALRSADRRAVPENSTCNESCRCCRELLKLRELVRG